MTDGPIYRIRRWDEVFERNRTREVKTMTWVALPLERGDGYTQIAAEDDGASIYGVWAGIIHVAAKCDPRGTLVRRMGEAHDSASISRLTGFSRWSVDRAWDFLVNIGWLELSETSQEGAPLASQVSATIDKSRGDEKREEKMREENRDGRQDRPTRVASKELEAIWALYPKKVGKIAAFKAMRKALGNGTGATLESLAEAVSRYAAEVRGKERQHIKNPQGWFNDGRYLDVAGVTKGAAAEETEDGARRADGKIFLHGQWRTVEQYETLTGKRLEA